jgi:hypothetical protein
MFNRFGATYASVLQKFKVAGYDPTVDEFGGQPAIDYELDEATRAIVQAMPARVRDALTLPDLMLVEARASAGQTAFALKLIPTVSGKAHVWVGPPQAFVTRPTLTTDPWWDRSRAPLMGLSNNATPPGTVVELDESQFSIVADTGIGTLVTPCNRNDQIFASYQVDQESASFALPSLADLAVLGASAVLGAKIYPQASSQWEYVARMIETWADGISGLAKGEWVPAEIRTIQWWQAPEPNAAEGRVGSVRKFRA